MFIVLLFHLLDSLSFGTNGTYLQCMPPSFYSSLGIAPGDRSELYPARFLKTSWDSGILVNDILAILTIEALGFKDSTWYFADGTASTKQALIDGNVDVAGELWHPQLDPGMPLTHLGNTGYDGVESLWISRTLLNTTLFNPGSFSCLNSNCLEYFLLHQRSDVASYIDSHDPIQYLAANVYGITDEIQQSCNINNAMLPTEIYLSARCGPIPRGNSTIIYPDGFEDVDLILFTGERIHLNTTSHILPPCASWNDVSITWHVNLFQSLLHNHNIPGRIYFWGLCRLKIIIGRFLEHNIPLIFYWWQPEHLMPRSGSEQRVAKIQFGSFNRECHITNTSNNIGIDSPNTCGFLPESPLPIVGGDYWFQEGSEDAVFLFSRFEISVEEINDMLFTLSSQLASIADDVDAGKVHFDVACNWVRNNTEKWLLWIPEEQYQRSDLQNLGPTSTAGMSSFEIILVAISASLIVIMILFYVASHSHFLKCLNRIGVDLLDIAAKSAFRSTFAVIDWITDFSNFAFVINRNANVTATFRIIYIVILSISGLVCLYNMQHSFAVCQKLCNITGSGMTIHVRRKSMSPLKHEKFKKALKSGLKISITGALISEDIPLLFMNLHFTFYTSKEGESSFFNFLAIIFGSMSIGIAFANLVNERQVEEIAKRERGKTKLAVMNPNDLPSWLSIREELQISDITDIFRGITLTSRANLNLDDHEKSVNLSTGIDGGMVRDDNFWSRAYTPINRVPSNYHEDSLHTIRETEVVDERLGDSCQVPGPEEFDQSDISEIPGENKISSALKIGLGEPVLQEPLEDEDGFPKIHRSLVNPFHLHFTDDGILTHSPPPSPRHLSPRHLSPTPSFSPSNRVRFVESSESFGETAVE